MTISIYIYILYTYVADNLHYPLVFQCLGRVQSRCDFGEAPHVRSLSALASLVSEFATSGGSHWLALVA